MTKILIFTSSGGGGHIAVTKALHELLEQEYTVKSVHIFTDVLSKLDPAQLVSFGKVNGEDFYNRFIQKKSFSILNKMSTFGLWYYKARKNKTEACITEYLLQEKPQLLISVTPLINNQILSVAQKLNIPFLLIPTDLDVSSFVANIRNLQYKKFICTLIFHDAAIAQTAAHIHFNPQQYVVAGLPLRRNFSTPKDSNNIKRHWHIPDNKPVILLLMGAAGSEEINQFAKQLATLKIEAHLLLCIGKYESSRTYLNTIKIPSHITYTVIGFTQDIADLMAVADLIITKSGSVSVCEALYAQVPMLLDATSPLLRWEKLNHNFINHHGFGLSITNIEYTAQMVENLLQNKQLLLAMKDNLRKFNPPQATALIPSLIKQLLND